MGRVQDLESQTEAPDWIAENPKLKKSWDAIKWWKGYPQHLLTVSCLAGPFSDPINAAGSFWASLWFRSFMKEATKVYETRLRSIHGPDFKKKSISAKELEEWGPSSRKKAIAMGVIKRTGAGTGSVLGMFAILARNDMKPMTMANKFITEMAQLCDPSRDSLKRTAWNKAVDGMKSFKSFGGWGKKGKASKEEMDSETKPSTSITRYQPNSGGVKPPLPARRK